MQTCLYFLSCRTKKTMGSSETLQDKRTHAVMGAEGPKHLICISFVMNCYVLAIFLKPDIVFVIFIDLMMHTGVQRSRSRRWRAVNWRWPSTGPGSPGSSFSNPRQWADSGGEAGLWVFWGGEEGRVAHTHWKSGEDQLQICWTFAIDAVWTGNCACVTKTFGSGTKFVFNNYVNNYLVFTKIK